MKPEKLTSNEWKSLLFADKLTILEPLGWSQGDFNYNFYAEKIELFEFLYRLNKSIIKCPTKLLKRAFREHR